MSIPDLTLSNFFTLYTINPGISFNYMNLLINRGWNYNCMDPK
jgi:hypothetical protein